MQYMARGNSSTKQYGISHHTWKKIREHSKGKKLEEVKSYFTEEIKRDITEEEIEHLYKYLLQGKYDFEGNRLIVVDDIIHCDDLEYGVGVVTEILGNDMMLVKFTIRGLPTMCNSKTLTTIHNDIKIKLTLKE